MRRRKSVVSLIVLVAVLAAGVVLSGCRTGAAPEAGLPSDVFAKDTATLTRGPQGAWHAVAAPAQELSDFVAVTFDDNTELFYATAKGDRTAAILPVTPVSRAWLNAAEKQAVDLKFADDPARLEATDPVGLWNGEDDGEVTWLGDKPEAEMLAAVLPATAPKKTDTRLGDYIVGVAKVSADGVSRHEGDFTGSESGYIVLPEPGSAPDAVRVVNISSADIDALGEPFEISRESSNVTFSSRPTEYEYLPVGRKLGADILVFDADGKTFVAAIGATKFSLRDGALRAVSAARVPLMLVTDDAAASAIRGLAYIKWRAPLSASYAFTPAEYNIDFNSDAASFRIAELAGAAGLAEWARIPIFADAEGATADRLLYFANAVALSGLDGDMVTAEQFYREAALGFSSWPSDQRDMGQARARTGMGVVLAAREEYDDAAEMLLMAHEKYKELGQPLYVADVEMLLADVFVMAGQNEKALEKAKVARSRYYHSNARYHAALAEMKMAELMLATGDTQEAEKNAGYAQKRLENMNEPIAANRAAIVRILASAEAGSTGAEAGKRLAQAFERAQNLNDAEGAAMAASALALYTNVRNADRLARIGTTLVVSANRIVDPLSRARAVRAIGVLCAQGLARVAGEDARIEAACSTAMANVSGDPATLRSWLAQGYSHLQRGDAKLANATLSDLEQQMTDELTGAEPVLAGRILVYRWAVGQLDDASKDSTVERAMTLFRDGLNPETAASRLSEMSRAQRARGLSEVAVWTLSLAIQQAKDAKKYELERNLTLDLLDTHRELSDWSALRGAARDATNVMARGGETAKPQLALAELYQAHAYYMLEKNADGDLSSKSARGNIESASDAEKLTFRTLAADFALERGDLESAMSTAMTLEKMLARGVGDKLAAAQAHLVRADSHLAAGNGTSALDAYAAGLGSVRTASIGAGGTERIKALSRLAGLADSVSAAEDYEKQIELALDTANADGAPLATARSYELAVEYHLQESDAGRANDLLDTLHEYGLSVESRFATDCLDGAVLLANGKSDEGVPRLERCVDLRAGDPAGELARVTLALAGDDMSTTDKTSAAKRALANAGDQLPVYERKRLEWLVEFAEPSKSFNKSTADRLRKTAQKSEKPTDLAAFADYLIATGRTEEASSFIDTNSTAFFREGQESPGELTRLRLETTVRELEPGAADFYAQRSLSEATDVDDAAMARIQLLLAQNSVIAGNWWSAHRNLQEARDLAENAGATALQKRIAEFADTFSILSFSE
ncbi:MAG: hypothetical protein ACQEVA_17140 [Myxococcota bacterium]